MERLVRNACRCKQCGEVLESTHSRDFKQCKCPNMTAIDGGLEYSRMLANDFGMVEDMRVYIDTPNKKHINKRTA